MGWLRRSYQIGFVIAGIAAIVCALSAAHAQCADTDKIYIDPRLVPKRGNMTPEQLNAIMHSPGITPEARNYLLGQYMQKPIEVPYGTGRVLVHPTNPCIQQYIP
jgi:hypothetical protein